MQFRPRLTVLSALLLSAAGLACGSSGDKSKFPMETAEQALADYKKLVYENYGDALEGAKNLKVAIDAFLADPNEDTHEAAKQAWIDARAPYMPSEVFRFYNGPIDYSGPVGGKGQPSKLGPEPWVNGWPLDESYIDYVRDVDAEDDHSLVNDLTLAPKLSEKVIRDANESAGEDEITTGYHAIEFLLWGQDDPEPGHGAGKRSYKDYLDEKDGGTAPNAARRKQYLSIVTDMLVSDLEYVRAQWDPEDAKDYGEEFGAGDDAALKSAVSDVLLAIGDLARTELGGERLTVAYLSHDQEDEHDCFSDNTSVDLAGNAVGIQNVWLGTYGGHDRTGLDEVVKAVDAELAKQMTDDIAAAVKNMRALATLQKKGTPLDVIIQKPASSSENKALLTAIQSLNKIGHDVEQAAKALGLSVQLDKPSKSIED
jgi:putative iron-regulated protein